MALLEITDLRYSVPSRRIFSRMTRDILRNISFRVESEEVLGVIGKSGSGKTTLAKCIAGLIQPTSGIISVAGSTIVPKPRARADVQLVFQNHAASLDPRMRIQSIIGEGIQDLDACVRREMIQHYLSLVGLSSELLNRFPLELSGGQRQRVALARALTVTPKLLILDEPTSALDMITQSRILRLLKQIQKDTKIAIIHITHDLSTARSLCDRIAVLSDGTIVEDASADKLFSNPAHASSREIVIASTVRSS